MTYIDEYNIPALLLSADFEKAFDSLEWPFIDYSLKRFNFGPCIQKWIRIFYSHIRTRITNNGWATDMFEPSRGSRQGCPLSPYIFIICAEILACMFRNDNTIDGLRIDNHNFIISQYADDTIIILKYTAQNLKKALNKFETYAQYSGLKINYDKTEIMPIGPIKYAFDILLPDSGMKWTTGPITCLGVMICHRTEELLKINYSKALSKIANNIKLWSKRYLTLYGKVVVLNTFIISQLIYLMSVLPAPPDELLSTVNTIIYNFIWNNKPDKIKRDIMKLPKCLGGISVPDIYLKNIALKVAWIPRVMTGDKSWNIWFRHNVPIHFDLFWTCNMNEQDATIYCTHIQHELLKQIIQGWFKYTFYNPTDINQIRNQIIWYNSHVKVDNKVLFNRRLYETNIIYVHHFFNNDGVLLDKDAFSIRHRIQINHLSYYSIISAIPRAWKREIRRHYLTENIPKIHAPLMVINQKTKVCKLAYDSLIDTYFGSDIATGYRKWNTYFHDDLTLEEWRQSFANMYRTTKCTKILFLHFKLSHYILTTKEQLLKYNIAEDDICSLCDEDIETIPHVLVECEVVKQFWAEVKHWLHQKCDILYTLSAKEIIFGIENSDLTAINAAYMIGKKYLYRCVIQHEHPTLQQYTTMLIEYMNVEKTIASQNNKMNNFLFRICNI